MIETFAIWFLYFMFYSGCGFFLEIIHAATNRGVLENRGFLFGPYCPIYGVGSLILIAATGQFAVNPVIVFLMAVVVCTTIEYITAVILEKIFKMRWWDYTGYPYNFQGRICLKNSVLFGFGGLAIIYITQPSVTGIVAGLSTEWLFGLATSSAAVMLVDFVLSAIANYKIRGVVVNSAQQIKSAAIRFYLQPRKKGGERK